MSALVAISILVLGAATVLWLPRQLPAHAGGLLGAAPVDSASAQTSGVKALLRRLRPRHGAAEAGEWVDWIRQLAALVRAGQSSTAIFAVSAQTAAQAVAPSRSIRDQEQISRSVAAAAALGRGPAETLRAQAGGAGSRCSRLERTRASVLRDLARCWEVSERTGAPLAALLDGVAEAAEADLDADAARETALAGARATVRILSWLPVLALGLGMLIGADPVRTLLTTPWGIAAGVLGAVLTILARVWTRRMVHQAETVTGHRAAPPAAQGRQPS